MEFYQVHARSRGAETVSDQGLVYTRLKECLRRCRSEVEAAALHQIAAHPAKCLATPGLSRLPRPFQYHSDTRTPGTHQGGQSYRRAERYAVSTPNARLEVVFRSP